MAVFERIPVTRRDRRAGPLVVAGIVIFAWSAANAAPSPAIPDLGSDTEPGAPQVSVSAAFVQPRFAATRALTDFGLDAGARYVAVRILESVEIAVDIQADRDVVLADDPDLCLVGPFAQPDYAGLSEACWGVPDLRTILRRRLPIDGAGRPILPAGRTVALRGLLWRDPAGCDYPPGNWRLEIDLGWQDDGRVSELDVPPVELTLPAATIGPLRLLEPTNYCGLANVAYVEQGEPPVIPSDVSSNGPGTP